MTMDSQDALERETHLTALRTNPEYRDLYIRSLASARLKESGDCYPFKMENVAEALREAPEREYEHIAEMLRSGLTMEAGYELRRLVVEHCEAEATRISVLEVENATK